MKQKPLKTILKGFTIGSAMLIPGVSGGTMAIIMNIYSELLYAVNNLRKDFKNSVLFLLTFCLGSGAGIILLSKPISYLVSHFNTEMMYLFIGVIAGSVPLIYKQSGSKKISYKTALYPIIGICVILLLDCLPQNLFPATNADSFVGFMGLFIAGIISAFALILPGISLTHMLLIMGIYLSTMDAISTFNILYLLPIGLGLVIGTFVIAKALDKCMSKYTEATFLIILGFIIGSVFDIFPRVIPEGLNLAFCLVLFAVGFFAMYKLSSFEKE